MSEYTVLCLTAANGKALTKSFDENRDFTINTPKLFIHEEHEGIHNPELMYFLLNKIQHKPSTAIVSGMLTAASRKLKTIERNKNNIKDAKRKWICLDVDSYKLPSGHDVVDEPELCVDHFVTTALPSEFRNSQYVYQLSSSCGVKSRKILKCHLFFMLKKAMKLEQVRKILEPYRKKKVIDLSTLSEIQLIYIAKPRFEVAEDDKYIERSRIGLVQQDKHEVFVDLKARSTTTVTKSKIVQHPRYDATKLKQTLGDGAGQLCFYNPIMRYIAHTVATSWHPYVKAHIEIIKEQIRNAIAEAEVSDARDISTLERYSSDEFLNSSILGACDKDYGKEIRDGVDNIYQNYGTDIESASKEMTSIFKSAQYQLMENRTLYHKLTTHEEDYEEINNKSYINSFTKLIKATAGLGKTNETINRLLPFLMLEKPLPMSFEIYVPSHKLAAEVADKINNIDVSVKSPFRRSVHASHIVGRTNTKNGKDVCKRKNDVANAEKRGLSVGKEVCGEHLDDENRCQFFDTCEYQRQFKSWFNHDHAQCAYVMSHDYLFIKRRDGQPKPDLVVIDETFYGKSIRQINIREIHTLISDYSKSTVMTSIGEYLDNKSDLLAIFRINQVTPEAIRNLAVSFKKRQIDGDVTFLHFDEVLEGLADELETYPNRSESRLFKVKRITTEGNAKDIVEYRKRRELTVPNDTPLLMIDADGDLEIAQLFRQDANIEYHEITAERNAIVHQFTDRTWSRNSLLNNAEVRQEARRFLEMVTANTNKTVIVMDKQVIDKDDIAKSDKFGFTERKVTINNETVVRKYFNNCPVIHFGGFRGTNEFEKYEDIIIVGRSEPRLEDMEQQAAALWYNDEEDLNTTPPDASGRINYPKRDVAYRMIDGRVLKNKASRHPDERVDKLLRLARDSETTQAIDRLRSVRSNADNPKTVWILCDIPMDITVTHLLGMDELMTMVEMVDNENCFIVHKDYVFFSAMERNKKRRNLLKWENAHFSNRVLSISRVSKTQFSVMSDSNSTFTAYIAANYDGSKEELIASKLGLTAEDITALEMDRKTN